MKRGLNWRVYFICFVFLASIWTISPTLKYLWVQNTNSETTIDEIDSLRNASPIKFGLDLQGGVDILLSVDSKKVVRERLHTFRNDLKSNFTKDKINARFRVIEEELALQIELTDKQDYKLAGDILDNYSGIFNPYNKNALREETPLRLTLNEDFIIREANQAIDGNLQVIKRRIDKFGLTQASVMKQGNDRIRIQLPGVRNPEEVLEQAVQVAQLEFRVLHQQNDQLIGELMELVDNPDESAREETPKIYALKSGSRVPDGYILLRGDRTIHNAGKKTIEKDFPYFVSQNVEMTGENLERSFTTFVASDIESPVHVNLEFDKKGAKLFKDITQRSIGRQLAIILDDFVYSAPMINQVIPFGSAYISGNFDMEEGQMLSQVLTAGSLKAPMATEEKRVVGATLGVDSIQSSVKAVLLGGFIVLTFMIIYYGWAGLVADIALILNVLIIFAVLAMANATLTLSGVGGILLTIGMAVDANVLIYERIREEILGGREKRAALQLGYRRAFTVILDSNMTTMITALVLLQFAEGSVQGFALTMTIGLLANLFTGLFVTYTLLSSYYEIRRKLSLGKIFIFRNTKLNFLSLRMGTAVVSALMAAAAIFTLVSHGGPIWGVEFTSGVIMHTQFNQLTNESDLRDAIPDARIQRAGENDFLIRMKLMEDDNDSLTYTQKVMSDQLTEKFGKDAYSVVGVSSVGTEIGKEFVRIAAISIFIASIFILIYIAFRFQAVFGVAAVIALLHDAFITLGFITLLGEELTLEVVSALLIVIGYSINDTIVIFDRIRETMRTQIATDGFKDVANTAINRSLSRTTITSLTSIIPMVILLSIGAQALEGFAITLIFGFIIGTYSSSFVATPIVYFWLKRHGDKPKTKGATAKTAAAS